MATKESREPPPRPHKRPRLKRDSAPEPCLATSSLTWLPRPNSWSQRQPELLAPVSAEDRELMLALCVGRGLKDPFYRLQALAIWVRVKGHMGRRLPGQEWTRLYVLLCLHAAMKWLGPEPIAHRATLADVRTLAEHRRMTKMEFISHQHRLYALLNWEMR